LHEVSELECVCCSCETNAVRRPAARLFVRDAQSAMRLPESGSRRPLADPFQATAVMLLAGEVTATALLAA